MCHHPFNIAIKGYTICLASQLDNKTCTVFCSILAFFVLFFFLYRLNTVKTIKLWMFIMCDKSFFSSSCFCYIHVASLCVRVFFVLALTLFFKRRRIDWEKRRNEPSIGKKIGILTLHRILLLRRKLNGNNISGLFARSRTCSFILLPVRSSLAMLRLPLFSFEILVHQSSWRRLFSVRER